MNENLEIFPWNENFETKIPIIDDQHKKLVALLNRLVSHILRPVDNQALQEVFQELKAYTLYHFQTEEEIWSETFQDDPWATQHKESHDRFILKVSTIQNKEGHVDINFLIDEIVSFLTHWLALHIIDTDKRMAFAVLAYRETGSIEEAKAIALKKMSGATRAMVDTIMSMYDQLTNRTLDLSREINRRIETEEKMKVLMNELESAKRVAEDATKAKSEFLAIMSHEIRTPLNAIVGMTHLVLQTDLNERQRKYMQNIKLSGTHIMGILNDILDFSKIEAGKMKLEETDFELEGIINLMEIFLKEKLGGKKILLFFEVSSGIPRELVGDPLRISQILLNLGYNAVKFTEKGSITVRILFISDTDQTVTLRFEIEDTGIGLHEEQIETLFQSFQQADMSTTRKYGGTGLGLSISKNLVELMQGKMGVESSYSKGSRFWFQIEFKKVKKERVIQKRDYISSGKEIEEKIKNISGSRILVVEDNELNQEVVVELVKPMGFEIEIARNGEIALKKLSEKQFDLILMDLQMPVMDGITAAKEIRKNSEWKNCPILAMTANVTEEDRTACLEAGMNDFLSKPMNPEILWRKIVEWLGGNHALKPDTVPEIDWNIPSIDTRLGLNLVGGKQEFYISLLRKFIKLRKNTVQEIRKALGKKDFPGAELLAHTIKGISGNLGALDLQVKSAQLEKSLKNPIDLELIEKNIQFFESCLFETVSSIERFLPPETEKSTKIKIAPEKLRSVFYQMKFYLLEDNALAIDLLDEERDLFFQVLNEKFTSFENDVRAYSFESGYKILEEVEEIILQGENFGGQSI